MSVWSAASSDLVRYARVVTASAGVQLEQLAAQPWIFFFLLAEPFMVSAIALSMIGGRPGTDATSVVIGAALIGLFTGFLFLGGSQMNQEKRLGTLEVLAGCPAPLFLIVTGKVAGSVVLTLVSATLAGVMASSVFSYPVSIADPPAFLLSAVLSVLCLWGLGISSRPSPLSGPTSTL